MPTYVYKCIECDHVFEVIHSYKDRLTNCKECNKDNTLKKQLNTPIYLANKAQNIKKKAGDLVKEEIRNKKEELEQQKEDLKKRNNKK